MGNPIVHWELIVSDLEKAKEFYRGVFDWSIEEASAFPGYPMIDAGKEPRGAMWSTRMPSSATSPASSRSTMLAEEVHSRAPPTSDPEARSLEASVHGILRNPIYAGLIRYKGAVYQGTHEPIISLDLFDETQAVFEPNRNGPKVPRTPSPYGTTCSAQSAAARSPQSTNGSRLLPLHSWQGTRSLPREGLHARGEALRTGGEHPGKHPIRRGPHRGSRGRKPRRSTRRTRGAPRKSGEHGPGHHREQDADESPPRYLPREPHRLGNLRAQGPRTGRGAPCF